MIRTARSSLALALALILAVTSFGMAMARGQTTVDGQIVICTSYGIQSITLDENGDRVAPRRYCPDCALSFFASAAVGPALVPALDAGRGMPLLPSPAQTLLSAVTLTPSARGPPVFV